MLNYHWTVLSVRFVTGFQPYTYQQFYVNYLISITFIPSIVISLFIILIQDNLISVHLRVFLVGEGGGVGCNAILGNFITITLPIYIKIYI